MFNDRIYTSAPSYRSSHSVGSHSSPITSRKTPLKSNSPSSERLNSSFNRGKDGIFRPKSLMSLATEIDYASSSATSSYSSSYSKSSAISSNPRLAQFRSHYRESSVPRQTIDSSYSSSRSRARTADSSYHSNFNDNLSYLSSSSTLSSSYQNRHRTTSYLPSSYQSYRFTTAYYAPKVRERPLLSNLRLRFATNSTNANTNTSRPHSSISSSRTTSISSNHSSSNNNSVNSNETVVNPRLERNKFLIKFREHNHNQSSVGKRKNSISWDIPGEVNFALKPSAQADVAETIHENEDSANQNTEKDAEKWSSEAKVAAGALNDPEREVTTPELPISTDENNNNLARWNGSMALNTLDETNVCLVPNGFASLPVADTRQSVTIAEPCDLCLSVEQPTAQPLTVLDLISSATSPNRQRKQADGGCVQAAELLPEAETEAAGKVEKIKKKKKKVEAKLAANETAEIGPVAELAKETPKEAKTDDESKNKSTVPTDAAKIGEVKNEETKQVGKVKVGKATAATKGKIEATTETAKAATKPAKEPVSKQSDTAESKQTLQPSKPEKPHIKEPQVNHTEEKPRLIKEPKPKVVIESKATQPEKIVKEEPVVSSAVTPPPKDTLQVCPQVANKARSVSPEPSKVITKVKKDKSVQDAKPTSVEPSPVKQPKTVTFAQDLTSKGTKNEPKASAVDAVQKKDIVPAKKTEKVVKKEKQVEPKVTPPKTANDTQASSIKNDVIKVVKPKSEPKPVVPQIEKVVEKVNVASVATVKGAQVSTVSELSKCVIKETTETAEKSSAKVKVVKKKKESSEKEPDEAEKAKKKVKKIKKRPTGELEIPAIDGSHSAPPSPAATTSNDLLSAPSTAKLKSPSEGSAAKPKEPRAQNKELKTSKRRSLKKKLRFREYTIDDFTFLKVLGRGSFGKVLLAELNGHDNVFFAVKCLKKQTVIEDDDIESIMIERKILAFGSSNPFICKLFCTFQTESHLFFAMEMCSGGDLMFHVQKEGKFPEEKSRFYVCEILCALWFMHKRGIIYRDLKLDNIMVYNDGHIRLVDFGMCQGKMYREDLLPSNFCGTPEYMAPEIVQGVKYNHSVDYWALGVVIYEMCVGTSPFHGTDEDELLWNVCHQDVHYPRFLSDNVRDLIVLLLKRNPQERMGMATCPAGKIESQPWLQGVDWDAYEKCKVKPPFVPELTNEVDVSYFDQYFTKEKACVSASTTTPISEKDQLLFEGFNYTNHNMTE